MFDFNFSMEREKVNMELKKILVRWVPDVGTQLETRSGDSRSKHFVVSRFCLHNNIEI